MARKIFIAALLNFLALPLIAQNPHGPQLKVDCAACHNPDSWEIPPSHWQTPTLEHDPPDWTQDTLRFHHDQTAFPLTGSHQGLDCRDCHRKLIFEQATSACISCHTDVHQTTVGDDCRRCHSTENWLIDDIFSLHLENGFPLLGAHATAECAACHSSETALRFDRLGNECVNCHLEDFNRTTQPNHPDAGFSTNCIQCHRMESTDWGAESIDHSFFPLELGHDIQDCSACHTAGDFSNTPSDCFECHSTQYENAANPNHLTAGFSTQCVDCHTTSPGWSPAEFLGHDDAFFPIYSGEHKGTWSECSECHTNPDNFAEFTCLTCHTNPETDQKHQGISGYAYESNACLSCHPTGSGDDAFDHDNQFFPIFSGKHQGTWNECSECHLGGNFQSFSCIDCHEHNDPNDLADEHDDVSGYEFSSSACYACHPTGEE